MHDHPHGWQGLLATAERLGHHLWLERELYEWLGRWSRVGAAPGVSTFLGEASARHGWHAELLLGRMPELREVDVEALVVPVDDSAQRLLRAACPPPPGDDDRDDDQEVGGDGAGPGRAILDVLAAHQRVLLPRLVGSYRDLISGASPASDRSLVRWLGFVVADDVEEMLVGDALLRSLVVTPDDVERITERERELELLALGCDFFPG